MVHVDNAFCKIFPDLKLSEIFLVSIKTRLFQYMLIACSLSQSPHWYIWRNSPCKFAIWIFKLAVEESSFSQWGHFWGISHFLLLLWASLLCLTFSLQFSPTKSQPGSSHLYPTWTFKCFFSWLKWNLLTNCFHY